MQQVTAAWITCAACLVMIDSAFSPPHTHAYARTCASSDEQQRARWCWTAHAQQHATVQCARAGYAANGQLVGMRRVLLWHGRSSQKAICPDMPSGMGALAACVRNQSTPRPLVTCRLTCPTPPQPPNPPTNHQAIL